MARRRSTLRKGTQKPTALPRVGHEIQPVNIVQELQRKYLSYAVSTIVSRSLPDVRDGLKPVHRRILWAMRGLKLNATDPHKKSARVVGDAMGKYHPHGDNSIYDALVRQAQSFSLRYPLVDGQGNFGNVDGDSAAAMRYTECRLTPYGELMMEGLDRGAVGFSPTYDGEDREPTVMPSLIPNLLANGSQGIAVGMATSIPSFNMLEIFDCLEYLLSFSGDARQQPLTEGLLTRMPSPDFAMGGVLVEPKESIKQAYETGRGGFSIRSKWSVEQGERGSWSVVVTELPQGIVKQRMIERIYDLMDARSLPDLDGLIDESDEAIRIRLVPRTRTLDPQIFMERLFQKTPLESRFSLNLNVLVGKESPRPEVVSIQRALLLYVDHQRDVLLARSHYRLDVIAQRLEILEAQKIVFLNLDEVLSIIRDHETPFEALRERFHLTERQAHYVLDTRLRSLRRIEEVAVGREQEALGKEKDGLEKLLASPARQDKELLKGFQSLRKEVAGWEGSERRTLLAERPSLSGVEEVKEESGGAPTLIGFSEQGWIKASRTLDPKSLQWKDRDRLLSSGVFGSLDRFGLITQTGRVYNIPVSSVSLKGTGDPVRMMLQGIAPEDQVVSLFKTSGRVLLASKEGYGFALEDATTTRKAGKVGMTLGEGDSVFFAYDLGEEDSVAFITSLKRLLIVPVADIPGLSKGRGVRLTKGSIVSMKVFNREDGLSLRNELGQDMILEERLLKRAQGKRAQAGLMMPKGFVDFA